MPKDYADDRVEETEPLSPKALSQEELDQLVRQQREEEFADALRFEQDLFFKAVSTRSRTSTTSRSSASMPCWVHCSRPPPMECRSLVIGRNGNNGLPVVEAVAASRGHA